MDINKIEKVLCEMVTVGFSPEYFIMVVNEKGEMPLAYALTPQHTKRLYQYLGAKIGEFEKQFGEIKAKWEPGIQSPIQAADLKGPQGPGKKK